MKQKHGMTTRLEARGRHLDLTTPQVMGILNVTPDSFSDGGRFNLLDAAVARAQQMVAEGATLIDIGGESTRPGAAAVSLDEELARVIPVVEALADKVDVWISVDTSKAEVMRAAADAGAHLINDVRALQEPGAMAAAAATGLPVCLMHMQGQPRTMQAWPTYQDVVSDVAAFFEQRISCCVEAGIPQQKIVLDPGFGFGKTLRHNYQLLAQLARFEAFNLPLLVGMSRKSMIGNLLNRPVEQRLPGSLACAVLAAERGARIIRVHDVQPTVDALAVWQATYQES